MSDFNDSCETERKAKKELTPFLGRRFGKFSWTTTEADQRERGDIRVHSTGEFVELKAEEEDTGNFFLETWSNKSRFTKGWMFNLNSNWLLWYFRDTGWLHTVDFRKLKTWAFESISDRYYSGPICDYREVPQRKATQRNDTWGHVVPIREINLKVTKVTSITIGRDGAEKQVMSEQDIRDFLDTPTDFNLNQAEYICDTWRRIFGMNLSVEHVRETLIIGAASCRNLKKPDEEK